MMIVIWKEICGINQAGDRVTWPDLLHLASTRDIENISSMSLLAHKYACKFLGMIGCFRVAPNSGPTLKSLLAPELWLVLDLIQEFWSTWLRRALQHLGWCQRGVALVAASGGLRSRAPPTNKIPRTTTTFDCFEKKKWCWIRVN